MPYGFFYGQNYPLINFLLLSLSTNMNSYHSFNTIYIKIVDKNIFKLGLLIPKVIFKSSSKQQYSLARDDRRAAHALLMLVNLFVFPVYDILYKLNSIIINLSLCVVREFNTKFGLRLSPNGL